MDLELERRKQRWRDLYAGANGVGRLLLVQYDDAPTPRPWPWHTNIPARIDWAWQLYQRQLERLSWLADDRIPALHPYTGTEVFAEAFGCRVHCFDDNMPCAVPLVHTAADVARLKVPRWEDTALAELFAIADELRRRAGPEAVMRLPDVQSPFDIAALIWDKNDFYVGISLEPGAVRDLVAMVHDLLVHFLDAWFARYGTDFVAHYPDYYMPAGGITLSEDEAGCISPEMFAEFCLPTLADLSQRYGRIGIHCCANSAPQWEEFKRVPNLVLLNLVQPADVLQKAYQTFADHTVQMHSWAGYGEAWTWPAQLPAAGRYVLQPGARDRDHARRIVEALQEQGA
jgi:hypothetical protein